MDDKVDEKILLFFIFTSILAILLEEPKSVNVIGDIVQIKKFTKFMKKLTMAMMTLTTNIIIFINTTSRFQ